MMTKTLVLVFATAALAGCGKDKPKAKTTPSPVADKPAAKEEPKKPEPVVGDDQKLSNGLAVSADIVAACGLKITQSAANPKFDYDKDELSADDKVVLDQIATCLTTGALKGKTVALIGRADPRGTEEYNLGLGSRRAASVGSYLGRLGVGQPQLAVTTRGALEATGTDESGWKNDRRVDIQLAKPEG
jgi:outer membrane protein OmpA-like peptidoglycan-associated protein